MLFWNEIYRWRKSRERRRGFFLLCQPPISLCTLNDIICVPTRSAHMLVLVIIRSRFFFQNEKKEKKRIVWFCVCVFEVSLSLRVFFLLLWQRQKRKSKQSSNIMSMYTHVIADNFIHLLAFEIDVEVIRWISTMDDEEVRERSLEFHGQGLWN